MLHAFALLIALGGATAEAGDHLHSRNSAEAARVAEAFRVSEPGRIAATTGDVDHFGNVIGARFYHRPVATDMPGLCIAFSESRHPPARRSGEYPYLVPADAVTWQGGPLPVRYVSAGSDAACTATDPRQNFAAPNLEKAAELVGIVTAARREARANRLEANCFLMDCVDDKAALITLLQSPIRSFYPGCEGACFTITFWVERGGRGLREQRGMCRWQVVLAQAESARPSAQVHCAPHL